MHRTLRLVLVVVALFLVPFAARAQLTIEIVGGAGTAIPIAIVPFNGEAAFPLGVSGIVGADLARSGMFRLVNTDGVTPRPVRAEEIQADVWRGRGADAVVVGSMQPLADGRVEVRFALMDVVKHSLLTAMTYTVTPAQFRATAHKIADVIYEKLTGDPGVFSTRIAYITKAGPRFQLLVADADGADPQTIVTSNEPLLSPRWSPDGTRIAYVSFEQKKPVVYVQNLGTGARQAVANFRGSNSAPAWSPDGRRLAVTLTKDGGSQIYLMNADGSNAQRVMSSNAIDTEAHFTADGGSLLFTSDRGGSPQIYRLNLGSNAVERLTFDGTYNVSARPSPDGKSFVFVRRDGGRFQIAIAGFRHAPDAGADERPRRREPEPRAQRQAHPLRERGRGRGTLAAVSSDGRVKQRLVSAGADVREPAWGPYAR